MTTIRLLAPGCHGSENDVMDCPGSSWGDHQAACDRQLAARIECQVEDIDGTISGELNRGGKKPLAPKLQRRICLFIDV